MKTFETLTIQKQIQRQLDQINYIVSLAICDIDKIHVFKTNNPGSVMITPEQMRDVEERESSLIRQVGNQMGFGRIMQLAQQEWRKADATRGFPLGGEFAYGPCVALTVECGCRSTNSPSCHWCNGSGWLTPRVKQCQDQFGIDG